LILVEREKPASRLLYSVVPPTQGLGKSYFEIGGPRKRPRRVAPDLPQGFLIEATTSKMNVVHRYARLLKP
jgi:hypothetical protein